MKKFEEFYCSDKLKWKEEIIKYIETIETEGWRITGAEPIEKIKVEIIGRRFTLEK